MYRLITCIPLTFAVACGSSSPGDPDAGRATIDAMALVDAGIHELTAALEDIRATRDIPALAAALVDNDGVVDIAATGTRVRGGTEAVTTADPFHLGSNTKAMTATLAAMLVDDGVLAWDMSVAELFPDLDIHDGYASATLRMLLAHRAGAWGNILDHVDELADLPEDAPLDEQRAYIAAVALASPPDSPPGDAFIYSNTGYIIVGAALERLTDTTWEQLITTRLFEPLGMDSCGFGPPMGDAPWGHYESNGMLVPAEGADNPAFFGPAGTVHCALADWAAFARAHLLGAHGAGALVSAESFEALHAPWPGGDYAAGWVVVDHPDLGRILAHDGSNSLWYARIIVAPDVDHALLVATNAANAPAQQAVNEATEALTEMVGD